jgi:membrane protein YqaA with SNARE-associated domain
MTVLAPDSSPVDHRSSAPRNRFRRAVIHLYAALHRWGESGWAGSAVAGWGLLQGSVVPGPSEAVLLPLGLADPRRAFALAGWATAGSTIGGLVAYLIGAELFDTVGRGILNMFGVTMQAWEARRSLFENRGWMLVVISTLSPLSTKFVCMAAGAFAVPFLPFTLALLGGRAARFLIVGALIRFAGVKLRGRLERWMGRPVDALA